MHYIHDGWTELSPLNGWQTLAVFTPVILLAILLALMMWGGSTPKAHRLKDNRIGPLRGGLEKVGPADPLTEATLEHIAAGLRAQFPDWADAHNI